MGVKETILIRLLCNISIRPETDLNYEFLRIKIAIGNNPNVSQKKARLRPYTVAAT